MRISSLYRSVAPWHPATAWAWAASGAVFVLTWISHGFDSGVRGGVAVFLAWAITRELAPRRAVAACVAPLVAVALAIPADTDLLACFGALLVARIASRSVGTSLTLLDLVFLVALAGLLATRVAGLPVALVLAAVVASDEAKLRARIAGVTALGAALVVGSLEGTMTARPGWDGHPVLAQLLLALTAVAVVWMLFARVPRLLRAVDDRRRQPLHGVRVRSARIAAVAALAATVAWTGSDGAFALSALSAALISAVAGARLRALPARRDPGAATAR